MAHGPPDSVSRALSGTSQPNLGVGLAGQQSLCGDVIAGVNLVSARRDVDCDKSVFILRPERGPDIAIIYLVPAPDILVAVYLLLRCAHRSLRARLVIGYITLSKNCN